MSSRKRIGLMVPSTNTTCEADFQMAVPRGITVHGQRLWLTNEGTGDEVFNRMNAEIEAGARYLATAKVDVIVYGCTTGSFFKGPGWDREMCAVIQRAAGVPAVATSPSVVEALRAFGARRISVATPYPDWNNRKLRAYLEAHGFEVLNVDGEPRAAASRGLTTDIWIIRGCPPSRSVPAPTASSGPPREPARPGTRRTGARPRLGR